MRFSYLPPPPGAAVRPPPPTPLPLHRLPGSGGGSGGDGGSGARGGRGPRLRVDSRPGAEGRAAEGEGRQPTMVDIFAGLGTVSHAAREAGFQVRLGCACWALGGSNRLFSAGCLTL